MKDQRKAKARIVAELESLREQVSDLQVREAGRERAEEALRQSEERHRKLVENLRDTVFTLSVDGLVTSLNPAFETVTGWTRAEWMGKPFAPILHPDDVALAVSLFRRVLPGEPLPHSGCVFARRQEPI